MSIDKVAKELLSTMKSADASGTKPYDASATVLRVEGDTAWVHIPGGVDETPVALTVNAKAGDTVQVRVSGGRAFIIGNVTAPPTDDTKAEEANTMAKTANTKANKASEDVAELAKKIGGNDNQYFWHVESGTDTGSHITEIPKDSFISNPQGNNILIRSNGIAIRDAMDEVSIFSNDGVRIGKTNETHAEVTKRSLKLKDNNSANTYFMVADLRNDSGVAIYEETHHGDGTTILFQVGNDQIAVIYSVFIDGVDCTSRARVEYSDTIRIYPAPSDGAEIIITYGSVDTDINKAFTFGKRENDIVGSMSIAMGEFVKAESTNAVAMGYKAAATGRYSVAFGGGKAMGHHSVAMQSASASGEGSFALMDSEVEGTYAFSGGFNNIVGYDYQAVFGTRNKNNSNHIFEIGNGVPGQRSNALDVDWGGNIRIALDTTASTGTVDGDLYAAITALGWEGDVIDA